MTMVSISFVCLILKAVDESIVKEGIDFDKEAIEKNLTLFLYPDDSDEAGNLLRIYQQYFMVSNAAQLILMEMKEKKYDLRKMYDYAVIQINDTHPTMIIPELIRILVDDKAFTMDEAIEVVSKTCAYTNHTILAEALEKWPLVISGKGGSSACSDHQGADQPVLLQNTAIRRCRSSTIRMTACTWHTWISTTASP